MTWSDPTPDRPTPPALAVAWLIVAVAMVTIVLMLGSAR